MKIIEAMALAKPIISTRVGALGIDYQENEQLLIADTPQEFVEQVKKLVGSSELRKRLGTLGRKLAIQKYGFETSSRALSDFYHSILRGYSVQ